MLIVRRGHCNLASPFPEKTRTPLDDTPTGGMSAKGPMVQALPPARNRTGLPVLTRRDKARRSSRLIRSASSTSISPKCGQRKESSTCSWQSTAPQSSPLFSWKTPPRFIPPPLFSRRSSKAVPYKIRTVLTDNGVQFCDQPSRRDGQGAWAMSRRRPPRGQDNMADKAEPSLDERPSRANEPNNEAGDRQTLPLRGHEVRA